MRRRMASIIVALGLAVGSGALAPAAVQAHDGACGGVGTAQLSTGLWYPIPIFASSVTTGYSFSFGLTGGCLPLKTGFNVTGTLTGYCGALSGTGTTDGGHTFSFTGVGQVLVLTGQVMGVLHVTLDPVVGGSCVNGSATRFIVKGGGIKCHRTELATTIPGGTDITIAGFTFATVPPGRDVRGCVFV